jgi:membrane-associated protease RseP (regulator of RpoE activity)
MSALYMIVGTLVALGVLVTFHEFGHFWVARRCGVKVLRFSVGFGMPLLRWHDKQGTEFVVAAIPLGGYVKMLDEREGEVPADQLDQSFNRKSVASASPSSRPGRLPTSCWPWCFSGCWPCSAASRCARSSVRSSPAAWRPRPV